MANVRQRAKFHRNLSNRCRNIAVYLFFKMAAVRRFRFVGHFWDDPQREFDGLYHCAKFGAITLVVLKIQQFEYFARLA